MRRLKPKFTPGGMIVGSLIAVTVMWAALGEVPWGSLGFLVFCLGAWFGHWMAKK